MAKKTSALEKEISRVKELLERAKEENPIIIKTMLEKIETPQDEEGIDQVYGVCRAVVEMVDYLNKENKELRDKLYYLELLSDIEH